jgi:hypothetical protein
MGIQTLFLFTQIFYGDFSFENQSKNIDHNEADTAGLLVVDF